MTNDSPTLSVMVMAFNEAANVESVVTEIRDALARLPGAPARDDEIVIIDDGSTDETGAVADRLAASIPGVRTIHHDTNRGLGGVYRTGFDTAARDLLMFFPADGQFPAEILVDFYPRMRDHDLVLGFVAQRPRSLVAKTLSRAEKLLYRLLFGPMPEYQGVFMVPRSVLSAIRLETSGRGWAIVWEMVLRISRGGYRVVSVETPLRPRAAGKSKVNSLRSMWINLKQALELRGHLSRHSRTG